MSASTTGLELERGSRRLRDAVELLSSMRFAIALLTVICIASVIGTVLKQHEPVNNYINQFGPFWSELFGAFQLYSVYSAWWFLLILAFLVASTSLCIARNTPKIFKDLKSYKENLREQSLKAFGHRAEADLAQLPEVAARNMGQALAGAGWKVKLQRRETEAGPGFMVAAKAGAANKLGYLAAHSAIVLICLGGLFDGDLVVKAQTWFQGKSSFTGGGMIADVPERHRLSDRNPTFRGSLLVGEGQRAGVAILTQPDGVLLQDLPFEIELKKFSVDYYSTGMPKLFASDIVIHDRYTGETKEARVEVNHPVNYRGVEIYQSSFDDGGSRLKLKGIAIDGRPRSLELDARIGDSARLDIGGQPMTVEFTGLRVINVENLGDTAASGADVRKVDLRQAIEGRLGAGHKTMNHQVRRNVGPSVSYKLRDASGQAREFNNYMLPFDIDGRRVFLLGVRDTPAEPFRYLRLPADDQDSMDGFLNLRAALADPALRRAAVRRYAAGATEGQRRDLTQALEASAGRALDLFAGVQQSAPAGTEPLPGGLPALSRFIESNVPQAERERASEMLLRILNGTLFELAQLARERAGLAALPRDERSVSFMTLALMALSDAFYYPVPMALRLESFEQVQASVFQVARAPGKTVVYLGCLFLILGVFAMLYVRERRLWVWLAPRAEGGLRATLALSSNRKTMDADREFETLKTLLLQTPTEVKA
ncbi:cytochrome c biogenesis protein ResB [Malikia sp.]|uniref:cytochrome c biogenesis protein ResB n=1 Tax=Malikia sp. TaxID=2070706 RepID=UPI00261ABE44|nr:cytochrome c biogenesis protein ResB [Malikia sp.]MDD2729226.1 cytochrome c biogenesis protein ResB [Malikia sp.]